jgi:hypothetical protein
MQMEFIPLLAVSRRNRATFGLQELNTNGNLENANFVMPVRVNTKEKLGWSPTPMPSYIVKTQI